MRIAGFDKNTDPELTVLYISSLILSFLTESEIIPYADLQGKIVSAVSVKAVPVIPYALSFLYTIGKIEYTAELDSFRRIKA